MADEAALGKHLDNMHSSWARKRIMLSRASDTPPPHLQLHSMICMRSMHLTGKPTQNNNGGETCLEGWGMGRLSGNDNAKQG